MILAGTKDCVINDSPWSVLHVVANHEKRVVQYLAAHSLEPYLPLYEERSRRLDRTVILHRPLFTGYVFVRFPLARRTTVLSAPGVLRLLGDDQYAMVSATEIGRIRAGLATGCELRPAPEIAVGARVRVRGGAFAGVEGVVAKVARQCKVILKLRATRQQFSVELSFDDLEISRTQI